MRRYSILSCASRVLVNNYCPPTMLVTSQSVCRKEDSRKLQIKNQTLQSLINKVTINSVFEFRISFGWGTRVYDKIKNSSKQHPYLRIRPVASTSVPQRTYVRVRDVSRDYWSLIHPKQYLIFTILQNNNQQI